MSIQKSDIDNLTQINNLSEKVLGEMKKNQVDVPQKIEKFEKKVKELEHELKLSNNKITELTLDQEHLEERIKLYQ